ncbi:MAG: hypothetical protein GY854_03745, partial [Deltaproteobacteria bacterium]|nr:hypothetical protein [Deltaproteobacteria bacterium]
ADAALDTVGEIARKEWKGEEYTTKEILTGAGFNFVIGESGALAAKAFKKLRKSLDFDDLGNAAARGIREGAEELAPSVSRASRNNAEVPRSGLEATRVTPKGIARIERHLTQTQGIEPGPAEFHMIERLRAGNRTCQDLRFYQHELIESRIISKYRNLIDDPIDAARAAHHETLFRQGLYRRGYEAEIYSPDALRLIGE